MEVEEEVEVEVEDVDEEVEVEVDEEEEVEVVGTMVGAILGERVGSLKVVQSKYFDASLHVNSFIP